MPPHQSMELVVHLFLAAVNHPDFHVHGVLVLNMHIELFNSHVCNLEWNKCKHHFVVINDNNSVVNILQLFIVNYDFVWREYIDSDPNANVDLHHHHF